MLDILVALDSSKLFWTFIFVCVVILAVVNGLRR